MRWTRDLAVRRLANEMLGKGLGVGGWGVGEGVTLRWANIPSGESRSTSRLIPPSQIAISCGGMRHFGQMSKRHKGNRVDYTSLVDN